MRRRASRYTQGRASTARSTSQGRSFPWGPGPPAVPIANLLAGAAAIQEPALWTGHPGWLACDVTLCRLFGRSVAAVCSVAASWSPAGPQLVPSRSLPPFRPTQPRGHSSATTQLVSFVGWGSQNAPSGLAAAQSGVGARHWRRGLALVRMRIASLSLVGSRCLGGIWPAVSNRVF